MSSISIRWERRALNELRRLPRDLRARIFAAVEELRRDPLRGSPLSGQWKGLRRLRVGTVHGIYGFDGRELLISALRVVHRREAYHR